MASSIGLGDGEAVVAQDTALSGWWRRVGATLIDSLILLVPIIGVAAVEPSNALILAVVVVFGILYAPLLMARGGANNGQTLGKQLAGIRVVHESGHPMDFGKGIIRDFVGKTVLGLVPLYGIVDSLWPLGDGRNQAIHDKIGSTTVHLADG